MTVYKPSRDEIKIILTHTEVIACFGSYEKLTLMGENIKASLSALISEVTKDEIKNPKDYEIKGQITAKKNFGCRIILKLYKFTKKEVSHTIYSFSKSEHLIFAVKTAFARAESAQSDLYLMPDGYRLVVKNCEYKILPEEFGFKAETGEIALAHTEEYGKLLILNNAISCLKKAFLKA